MHPLVSLKFSHEYFYIFLVEFLAPLLYTEYSKKFYYLNIILLLNFYYIRFHEFHFVDLPLPMDK